MNLNGEFIGKVIYNEDPTFTGRCKVRVFGLFDELDENVIPWFVPVNSNIFSTSGAGSLSVPKLNDIVRVRFSNGDYYSGEYYALQCVDPALVEEIKDDYENSHVLLFDAAKELVVSYQVLTGLKLYLRGASIIISPTGAIQIKHQNNANVIELNENDITITTASSEDGGTSSTGTINITSGNTVNINANTVNVSADSVNLGNNPAKSAVVGEELQKVLMTMSKLIDSKCPQGGSASALGNFSNILSKSVKLS